MKDDLEILREKLKEIEHLIQAGQYKRAKERTKELRKEMENDKN